MINSRKEWAPSLKIKAVREIISEEGVGLSLGVLPTEPWRTTVSPTPRTEKRCVQCKIVV